MGSTGAERRGRGRALAFAVAAAAAAAAYPGTGAAGPAAAMKAAAERTVAEKRFDLDGDGVPDIIRIGADAEVSVQFSSGGQPVWKPFSTTGRRLVSGTIQIGTGPNFGPVPIVVATAAFAGRRGETGTREALVLAARRGRLRELWRGPVGPQGPDGAYSITVTTSPYGLLEYETRPDVRRCDGRTARLFLHRFDFREGRFRPASEPAHVPEGAPRLVATRRRPAAVPAAAAAAAAVVFAPQAASSQRYAQSAGDLTPPVELGDGDPHTAWVEGATGNGRGEFVTIRATLGGASVRALRLIPGNAASRAAFRDENRLKRVALWVGDHPYWVVFPRDPLRDRGGFGAPYWVVLPKPMAAKCVSVVLRDVYSGRASRGRRGDTAISELAVLTNLELGPGGADAALAARVAAGGASGRQAARVLAHQGAAAATAAVTEAKKPDDSAAARLRLRRVLADLDAPVGAAEIAAGLRTAAHAPDRQQFAAALAHMGAPAVAPLRDLLADTRAAAPARVAAAAALAANRSAAAREALIAAAGTGSPALRAQVARDLGGRPATELDALVKAAAAAKRPGGRDAELRREADLWRAVGLMARRAPAGSARAAAATALAARFASVRDLATAGSYELAYRLTAATCALAEPHALAACRELISRPVPKSGLKHARAVALRRVAATALGESRAAGAPAMLASIAGDADAGVRAAAVGALAAKAAVGAPAPGAARADRVERALIARLTGDHWPEIRRNAAGGLATRCGSGGAAARALERAVDRDGDVSVRRAALSALTACRAPGIGRRLLAVAAAPGYPGEVRQLAARLLGNLGARAPVRGVIALLAASRRRAWSDKNAIDVAAAAAGALARLGNRAAIPALTTAARDNAFPEIQAAAALALGSFCPRGASRIFDRLAGSHARRVVIAARAARARCRR